MGQCTKMAASLSYRWCINQLRLTNSLLCSNSRLFSVKNDGSHSSNKLDTEETVKTTKSDCSNEASIENQSPVTPSSKNFKKFAASSASASEQALDKFAKVIEKVKAAQENAKQKVEPSTPTVDPNESFASMLRKSHFVSLGDVAGRLVEGKIFEVMGDDLYIDFGGKFHCVCPRPKNNGNLYRRGTKVLLSLQCLEMSSAFLGSDVHVTLLEADATLLGLSKKSRLTSPSQPL
ncbi:28S ribosomal protein S28, mitochondrial-like [Biomphalaria glabrata]|uniref:28S ribosomal protein S28, mitochondrial-like n=1 Tax=Biomphalaria glabrata TaxID=6526 RepID=A0A9U8DZE2_BIOGL|nr:28S ribosomal protein S28, mitochondrial-like [Biomphalaria glabrata]